MDSVYIVMPAYNEEGIIEETIYRWYGVLDGKDEKSRLVVADSESTDKTHEILMRLKLELPQLEILSDTGKQHGPKVMALYDYAIKMGGGWILFSRQILMDRQIQENLKRFGIREINTMGYSATGRYGETANQGRLWKTLSVNC